MAERSFREEIVKGVTELWWLWVIQAIAAILFGVAAIFWPGLTLMTLVYLIAPFVIAVGLIETVRALMTVNERDTWWMSLVIGFLTLGVGVFLARHPDISFTTFILVVGVTFIAWGVLDVAKAFLDRVFTSHRTLSFISGIAGVIAGVIVLLQPLAGGVAFVWVLGIWALIYGVTALAIALDHHKDYQQFKTTLSR